MLKRFVHNNGLSLAIFALFIAFLTAESFFGHLAYNNDLRQHGKPQVEYVEFLASGRFIESTAENWESEFLEMTVYVFFTAFLYQKGSAESKSMQTGDAIDRDPLRSRHKAGSPWPVRRGGWVLRVGGFACPIKPITSYVGFDMCQDWRVRFQIA
jgi:hypothetical protein